MSVSVLLVALALALASTIPSGAYLCDEQGRCPKGYECREERCWSTYDAGQGPPQWIVDANELLRGQEGRIHNDVSQGLTQMTISNLSATEICTAPLQADAWPPADGTTLKIIARHDAEYSDFTADISDRCAAVDAVANLSVGQACAWLFVRNGDSQSLAVASHGRASRETTLANISVDLRFEGESFLWYVDYLSCP